MDSTFTLAKTAVFYMHPVYFIGLRMLVAGSALLGYLAWFKREHWRSITHERWQFAQIVIFHIYCAYVFEYWALQYITSSKTCLLYNFSPFITALLVYLLFKQKLTTQNGLVWALDLPQCCQFWLRIHTKWMTLRVRNNTRDVTTILFAKNGNPVTVLTERKHDPLPQ